MNTVEFWSREDWGGATRDDQMAAEATKDDLAKVGYIIDRLKPMAAVLVGRYWKYTIPVLPVVA